MVDGGCVGVSVPLSLLAGLVHRVALTASASTLSLLGPPFIVAGDPPPLQSRQSSCNGTRGLAPLSSASWARDNVQSPSLQPPLGTTPMSAPVPMMHHCCRRRAGNPPPISAVEGVNRLLRGQAGWRRQFCSNCHAVKIRL